MSDYRLFPRVRFETKASAEFVGWKVKKLNCSKNALQGDICDISVQGVGLSELPNLNDAILKQLESGKKKIRLNFTIRPDHQTIETFARLIKYIPEKNVIGLEFVDIPVASFVEIRDAIDEMMESNPELKD